MLKLLKSYASASLKVELLTVSARNWFKEWRVDTNLCQVLINVKYTRDWQLGLKKDLQDSVVKPQHKIIFY